MSEKPDWFKLKDEESASPTTSKPKKRFIKIALITAPLILVGGALVFADGGGEDDLPNFPSNNSMNAENSNSIQASDKANSNSTNTNGTNRANAVDTNGATKNGVNSRGPIGTGVPAPIGGHEGGHDEGHESKNDGNRESHDAGHESGEDD